ncbi:MAG: hypothetical protein M3R38_00500 [Actinomycetota bacterium]|nr:hypothetical protein [Actinomycetota bacterium]
MPFAFDKLLEISANLAPLATTLALLIGGYWTWRLYRLNRQSYPRAQLSHRIMHRFISDKKVLLRVDLVIENQGNVLLPLRCVETWVQQMQPWTDDFLELVQKGDPVEEDGTEVKWTLIADREKRFAKRAEEIEPGERDEIHFDFVIDGKPETVLIYTYLENHAKRRRTVGWRVSSVYDLVAPSEKG